MEHPKDPKQPFRAILTRQKEKSEKALTWYKKLMDQVPEEEAWKYKQRSIFWDRLGGLVTDEIASPVPALERVIRTIDEYLVALDSFTDDQFAAFLLGLGLTWIPVRYWGIQELQDYYTAIKKAEGFYEQLLSETSEDERWKYKKTGIYDLQEFFVPPDEMMPTQILKIAADMVDSMLTTLTDRPF